MGEKSLVEERVLSPEDFVAGYQYITGYLKEGVPIRDVLKRALKYFEDRFEDSHCTIMLLNNDGNEFVDGVSHTLSEDIMEQLKHFSIDRLGCGQSNLQNEYIGCTDLENDPDCKPIHRIVKPFRIKSCWAIPVRKPGTKEVIAAFAIFLKVKRNPTNEEIDTIKAYNELIALIISNYINSETGELGYYPSNTSIQMVKESETEYVLNIKDALNQGDIYPVYQPIIKNEGKELYGFEALARWRHPVQGLIAPDEFIGSAEAYDVIDWLDEVVCQKALIEMKRLIDHFGKPFVLSVNISAVHIRKENFAERIEQLLDETQFPAKYLSIEITETSLMENLKDVAITFQKLKNLGVKISIDDFGTTYSSLNYLKYLPVDAIKLDRSFIHDIDESPVDRRICKTIIQLGVDLELDVIAEGVEHKSHLNIIESYGCSIYQGYYFSKPLSYTDCQKFLNRL